jgi:hypothetical protein
MLSKPPFRTNRPTLAHKKRIIWAGWSVQADEEVSRRAEANLSFRDGYFRCGDTADGGEEATLLEDIDVESSMTTTGLPT